MAGVQRTIESKAKRAEFDAVMASGTFPPHSNGARFLEYVAAQYFANELNVNEYAIGVDGLGRRKDFDPKQDAIVRVEAHRVRKRLADYYVKEGIHHELRLTIPHGSYLPLFVPRENGIQPVKGSSSRTWSARTLVLFGAVALLFLAGGIAALTWPGSTGKAVRSRNEGSIRPAPGAAIPDELRIHCGSRAEYKDRLGQVWSPDSYFTGGQYWTARYRRILRTRDPDLFLSARQGREFSYDIPLNPGTYELRLYFAETYFGEDNPEGGGESSRMFSVSINGTPVLDSFDPLSDANGSNTADVRVFRAISAGADRLLHLRFFAPYSLKSVALVSGIEIVAARNYALRWVASDSAVVDSANQLWQPDQFSFGGRIRLHAEPVKGDADPSLFRSDRYGHFSYAVPVPPGTYALTLHFAEQWFGIELFGGANPVGRRVFDVFCNGVALLRDFDIAKEAGGSLRAVQRKFRGLRPNPQGKLLLEFVPSRDYACLNALEVTAER